MNPSARPANVAGFPSSTSSSPPPLGRELQRRPRAIWALVFILPLWPAFTEAQFAFTTNNGTITITKYTGSDTAVAVPAWTNGFPVTSIGNSAFASCASVSSVIIPNSVSSIGSLAFYKCTSLSNIVIPDSVLTLGSRAFDSCSRLVQVSLGTGVTNINDMTFFSCSKLSVVAIPGTLTSIGAYAFNYCTSLTNITLPSALRVIGADAFESCSEMTNISIPDSVNIVGDGAFYGCANLANVTLGNGVTNIGQRAFEICGNLTSVTIPQSVTSIGPMAFSLCGRLTSIIVDPSNPAFTSVSGVLFDKGQTTLIQSPGTLAGRYEVPSTITNIADGAFYSYPNLTNVVFPKALRRLGFNALSDCTSLLGAYFQGNGPSQDGTAFRSDSNIVYYLPGTSGWSSTFAGRPAMLWNPTPQIMGSSFGVRTNVFGFNITGTTGIPIVIEACTNLVAPFWIPLQACTLTNGLVYFGDSSWTNYRSRLYRISGP